MDFSDRQVLREHRKFYEVAASDLIEFARHEFRLSVTGKDGKSLRETLKVVEKRKGRTPKELINPVEFPAIVGEVWDWFISLDSTRQNGMERQRISESETGWFFINRRIKPEVWQLDLIRKLDAVSFEKKE